MHSWEMSSAAAVKMATPSRWTAPPGWPDPPAGWMPPFGWQPDPHWGPALNGWAFWRCAETAADITVDPRFRNPELDAKLRPHVVAATTPASSLAPFLDEIKGIANAALYEPDAARVVQSVSRDRLLLATSAAGRVLTHASTLGAPTPFVFFACIQDAVCAAAMFGAELSRLPTSVTAPADVATASPPVADTPLSQVQEAQKKGQQLFDATVARVMALFHRAVDDIRANPGNAMAARRALRELDEVKRLVEAAGSRKSMPIGDLLRTVDALDACGRRAAAALGVRY